MQTYVVCEDDKVQLDHLCKLLDKRIENKNIIQFQSGKDLLEHLDTIKEGTIFLMDIVLDGISGIDIAKIINHSIQHCAIIFLSAFLEKVTDVYEAAHCYFVYKPELEKRLPAALKRAEKMIEESKTILEIKSKNGIVLLAIAEICYIEREKRTTIIHCQKGSYVCPYNLQYFMDNLSASFLKCHCSYIVNMNMVQEYQRTEFHLRTGMIIPISRAFSKETKKRFQDFIMNNANQTLQI